MLVVEVIVAALLVALAGLTAVFVRREVIARAGGTIDMNMRLSTFLPERGWAPGLGRFVGEDLRWYRMFSLDPRPRRVLRRNRLVVEMRRPPEGAERVTMPTGWVVVHCRAADNRSPVELALAESALNGFLSWLEAAPPGARHRL
jgi:Protein of unknown function (DUF2550)